VRFDEMISQSALVVFSGGQDSTTCLYWAKRNFSEVKTISFDYGQRHEREKEAARKICELAGVEFDLIKIPEVLRSSSPLVDRNSNLEKYESVDQLPGGLEATFVPARNILFLTIAANIAMHHGIRDIVIGVCEEDYGGYYDCRASFITAMQTALSEGVLGAQEGIRLHTPLMKLTKAETVKLAVELGDDCMHALAYSHTCYEGVFPPCGKCHACHLRARGFEQAGVEDPLTNNGLRI
jgi:7-cyano-7-deazaguanine synthase